MKKLFENWRGYLNEKRKLEKFVSPRDDKRVLKLINLAEQGKSNEFILNKIGKPKKVSAAQISEVINKLVEDGDIKEKYKRVKFSGIPQFELDKRNKIINDMIKKYPGLKLQYEKFMTVYNLIKDEYKYEEPINDGSV